ncbi:transglutaminase domain-containing protein [Ginsengibacter hankyongi]|uniref:Transglutaminase domain-containing protein n=2 Tax=Ginsengibacter hankyongi TaxID=2607284 RepID=A0A5J5IGV4_9BACT|nr:transglutaminase domain-containing protein [Ginsengibacter hankyongi]
MRQMKIEKKYSAKKIFARITLLIIPAIAIGAYLLWHLNEYYGVLESQWATESLFLATGLIAGCLFYSFRFRFITTTLPLLLLLFIIGKIVSNIYTGEFTAFYAITKFYIFSFLFFTGWLAGWGFARLRWFPVILSSLIMLLQIIVISNTSDITAKKLVLAFAPVLVFSFYIVYTAELVRNMNEDEPNFSWFIVKKLLGFVVAAGIILLLIFSFYKKDFLAIEQQYGGGKSETQTPNKESLTKENKDGTVSNKKQMGLSGGRSSTKRLVFIAKLDNYFPKTDLPNPLYFTYDYYTKFDTLTQTLEVDSLMPSNDLFQPDPSKIPLYFTQTDSSVLLKSKGYLDKKVVSTEVYKALLSPKEFLAPATAFFCQPIAVEKEYKQQFKSAYRAKMMVSDLNSAYFVYNPAGNKVLENFQTQRFNLLRQISNWNNEDSAFMSYYTFIPKGDDFDSIRALAKEITKNATTPIDKIIAVRNYFLSTDETGQPLFKYTDNPGVPGLPSASKLNYFLFQNRKGYCAYYAGATLFLLRALGIPTRVSTGFLTMDRSTKNKGWYWFYEDQAHAWTQVYFPGYGWLDFDTTIPSTEQQQAPAPDGTPPITVQTALFVTHGKVIDVDTLKKRVDMSVSQMIYHDKTFDLKKPVTLNMDVSLATITRDSGEVPLSELKVGNEITALSFSDQFKNISLKDSNSYQEIVEKIPTPAPIDEIKIIDSTKEQQQIAKEIKKQPASLTKIIWIAISILALFILLIFSLPWLIFQWFNYKARHTKAIRQKAYWSYNAAAYYCNQLGYSRDEMSPTQFAKEKIDAHFKTNFYSFMLVYLKSKYSKEPLTHSDENVVQNFYPTFYKTVKNKIPFRERFSKFLNYYRTINFFSKPKI